MPQSVGFMDVLNKQNGNPATPSSSGKGFLDVLQDSSHAAQASANSTISQPPQQRGFIQMITGAPDLPLMTQPEALRLQPQLTPAEENRLGNATDADLASANRYLVQPFERAAKFGGDVGRDVGTSLVAQATGKLPPMIAGEGGVPLNPQPMPTGAKYRQALADTRAQHPVASGIAGGVGSVAGGLVTDPRNYPFFLEGLSSQIARRLMSAGFSAQMAHSAIQSSTELGKIIDNPNVSASDKVELGTSAVLNTLMAAGAGTHALAGEPSGAPTQAAEQPEAPTPSPEHYAQPSETPSPAEHALPIKNGKISLPGLEPESDLEAARRGASGEQPIQPAINQVPVEQRASTLIPQEENDKFAQRIEQRQAPALAVPGEVIGYAAHDGKPIIDMSKAAAQEPQTGMTPPSHTPATTTGYNPSESDVSDAIRQKVISNPDASAKLRVALQQSPVLHIADPTEHVLGWYTDLIISHWADGERQPFDRDTVEAVMRAAGPEDLLRYRELRNPGAGAEDSEPKELPQMDPREAVEQAGGVYKTQHGPLVYFDDPQTGSTLVTHADATPQEIQTHMENSRAGFSGVKRVPTSEINLDPQRFQFKLDTNEQGVSNLLKGQRFNEDLAGLVSVWRDPADGKLYAVNGHHRVVLAKETGHPAINVRALNAPDARTARAIGALQNIAEGRGTALDAAKFFRDSNYTPEKLAESGISMGEATASNGLALSRLDPFIFEHVVHGRISQGRGIAIGRATSDGATQEALLKLIDKAEAKGKRVSDDTVSELARMAGNAGSHTENVATLFGEQAQTHSLALEKAEVSAYIKKQLSGERKVFGSVSSESKASQLSTAGNQIKASENARISRQAAQLEEAYDTLSTRRGPVDDILEAAAKRLARGENPNEVKTQAYRQTRKAVSEAYGGANQSLAAGVQENPAGGNTHQQEGELGQQKLYSGLPLDEMLRQINSFYSKHAESFIQKIGLGRTHGEVEKVDPELAKAIRIVDNAPAYYRQKARDVVSYVSDGLSRPQERLFTLLADQASRDNLAGKHSAEYWNALSDPKIQDALRKYKPLEDQMREARRAMGGAVIEQDYLRRVYEQHTAGIGKREGSASERTPFSRVITPERVDKHQREAEAEYHYQNGVHEFGPAFGTKYVATMLKLDRNRAYTEFATKATQLDPDQPMPRFIDYNGKRFYHPEVARDMEESGKKGVPRYAIYDSSEGKKFDRGQRFLAPKPVVDGMRGLDSNPEARKDGGFKRFLIENTVGFGAGIPHAFNIFRRISQSFPGGVANPVAWVKSAGAIFSRELKARAISGTNDPTFDALLRHGGISPDGASTFKSYIGGNLNPANWVRMFSKVGHDVLFRPGGVDQRARLYIADLVKSQQPKMTDADIAQRVREQLGNYTRVNWPEFQTRISRFMLFPGWDASSVAWVIRHPVRTSVPAAVLVLLANNVINAAGGNKQQDRFDFSNVHIGNRAYGSSLINEPIARKIASPALSYAASRLKGETRSQSAKAATKAIPRTVRSFTDLIRPDLLAPFEVVANKDLRSGDIVKRGDFTRPGKFLPNKAAEKYALFALKKLIPEIGRITDSGDSVDLKSLAGGTVGVPNYRFDAEKRILQRAGAANDTAQVVSEIANTNPAKLKQYFSDNPDAAVLTMFHGEINGTVKELHTIDRASEIIGNDAKITPQQKQNALAQLDQLRGKQLQYADAVDTAIENTLGKVQKPVLPWMQRPKSPAAKPASASGLPFFGGGE